MQIAATKHYRRLVDGLLSSTFERRPEVFEMLQYYASRSPSLLNEKSFYGEVCWITYSSGFRHDVVRKCWPRIRRALYDLDVRRIASEDDKMDKAAKRICEESGFRNYAKASWCVYNAKRVVEIEDEWDYRGGIRGFFERLANDSLVNQVRQAPVTVQELGLKGIGGTTIFHLLKNVGIDIFKPDIHVRRLLTNMKLVRSEDAPIEQISQAMVALSEASGYRITQVDTLLFAYGITVGDSPPRVTVSN